MNRSGHRKQAINSWLHERWELWRRAFLDYPILVYFGLAVFGVLVQQALRIPTTLLFGAALLLFLGELLRSWHGRFGRLGLLGWLSITTLFAALHGARLDQIDSDPSRSMATDAWSPVVFEAVVDNVPRWRPDVLQFESRELGQPADDKWQTILEVQLRSVRDGQNWRDARGRLLVTVDGSLRKLLPGDRLRVFAQWQRIPHPSNPGQVDLATLYQRRGHSLRARCEEARQVEFIEVEQPWRLDRLMARLLERGDRAIHRHVILSQGKLASALVLGQRDQVEWELQEALLATGTMHMLAISGLHVEMVAISVVSFALLVHFPRRATIVITGLIVVCYGILCGGQPPVLRAVILVVLVCIARWNGRPTNSLNLLALAGLILLAVRTTSLFDIGTQLSFLAVAMLAMLSMHTEVSVQKRDPLAQVLYESQPFWRRLVTDSFAFGWELVKTSTWVWAVTTPLVLSAFHVVSPVAILLNILLWLPLLIALLSGLGIVMIGTWVPWVGAILGFVCGLCLWGIEKSIDFCEFLPLGHAWLPAPSFAWTMVFYVGLIAAWSVLGFAKSRRWLTLIALGIWVVIGLLPIWFGPKGKFPLAAFSKEQPLRVTLIDVGHGTSVLIQTPYDESWLYDAGRMGDGQRSFQVIAGVLWHENISRLDGIFLSHADSDHYNAIPGISKRFAPGYFHSTSQVMSHSSPGLRMALTQLQRRGVELNIWAEGGAMEVDGVQFQAIHPPQFGIEGNDNANSLCLVLRYAGRTILLPGDLESPGTERLLNQTPIKVDLLMAPHHGSISQDPRRLLDWCQPDAVAISGGPRASNPKVLEAYQAPDRKVLLTHRDGAIRFEVDRSGRQRIMHWRDGKWFEF